MIKSIVIAFLSVLVANSAIAKSCRRSFYNRSLPDRYTVVSGLGYFTPERSGTPYAFRHWRYRSYDYSKGFADWVEPPYIIDGFFYEYSTESDQNPPNSIIQLLGGEPTETLGWDWFSYDDSFFYTDSCYPGQEFDDGEEPPDPPCPDLNLTIRGTLLPARRGTARVTGDWCH